ncbi:hypothetical protein MJO29_015686 [Puccinia striiformis f. sp. tritici]|nr:hypothetical protein MJO29_015686 [Puccinia striiformis f. sp. tritici]
MSYRKLYRRSSYRLPSTYRGRLAHVESLIFHCDTLSQATNTENLTSSATNIGTQISNQQIELKIFSLFPHPNIKNPNNWKTGSNGLRLLEHFEDSSM